MTRGPQPPEELGCLAPCTKQFYGLSASPFSITPDPRYLFFSRRHREAFEHMLYGITQRKGFIQITGEVGAGKSTLCRAVLEQLRPGYATALILNPVMSGHPAPAHDPARARPRPTAATTASA